MTAVPLNNFTARSRIIPTTEKKGWTLFSEVLINIEAILSYHSSFEYVTTESSVFAILLSFLRGTY